MKKIYRIEKLFCRPCLLSMKNGLNDLDGVEKVVAHLRKDVLEIDFDENLIGIKDILNEIKEYGDNELTELTEIE